MVNSEYFIAVILNMFSVVVVVIVVTIYFLLGNYVLNTDFVYIKYSDINSDFHCHHVFSS